MQQAAEANWVKQSTGSTWMGELWACPLSMRRDPKPVEMECTRWNNSQVEISTELRVSNEECTQPQLNPPTMQGAKKQETSGLPIMPLWGKQTGLR